MKKTLFVLLVIVFNSSIIMAQQITPKLAFLEKWKNSKDYLIAIAELMPEDAYNYKPTEREMTFKEQLVHIKENMEWLSTSYFSEIEYKKTKNDTSKSKAETITELENAFDSVTQIIEKTTDEDLKETVEFFAGPKSKLQILNLLQDHVTHHRGQLIVYLNLNGIKPPQYSGW